MKKIELLCGCDLKEAIIEVRRSAPAKASFNTVEIYSHESDDEIFKKVTGMTAKESELYRENSVLTAKIKDLEHQIKMPELIKEYCEKAEGIITRDHIAEWKRIVPIRLSDLYKGMELQCTLDLVPLIDDGCFEEAETIFKKQGHSGMSAGLMFQMLRNFSINGGAFVEYVKSDKPTDTNN